MFKPMVQELWTFSCRGLQPGNVESNAVMDTRNGAGQAGKQPRLINVRVNMAGPGLNIA